ncbi:MAG: trigger factor [Gammaproteobacteria bacterium WSBS_2016_MAG_OTU1]
MSDAQVTSANDSATEGAITAESSLPAAQTDAEQTSAAENAENAPPKNPLAREVIYIFAAAEVDAAVDKQLMQIGKTARINGFRPGHVPMRVMRQRWGGQCRNDVLAEKSGERFNAEAPKMTERPAVQPQFAPAVSDKDDEYRVMCRYEVMPEIAAPDLESQEILRPLLEVGEQQVDEMIEKLRRDSGHYHEVSRAAREEDSLQVDFEAFQGDELAESGKDRRWILDSPMLNGELAKQLIGAASGDSRTVTIKHPDTHPEESMRGVEVRMEIKINTVAELHLPELNDEFFARFGIAEGGESAFRVKVSEQLKTEVTRRLQQSMHTQSMNALIAATPKFDLPYSLVQSEAVTMYQRLQEEARQNGMPEVSADVAPHIYSEASRRVALGLIIAKWQERENPQISEAEIHARLDELAADRDDGPAFKEKMQKNDQAMRALQLAAIEERVVKWVCERAKITDNPLTLSQLLDNHNHG